MKRIFFVLGALAIMGVTASFSGPGDTMDPGTGTGDGGCEGGSRVCCVTGQVNHV